MPSEVADRLPRSDGTQVVHFGDAWWVAGGGISAVIRRHLDRELTGFSVEAVATVDPAARGLLQRNKHVPRAWLTLLRLRARDAIAHVHLSQRGSLVREGSLLVAARLLRIRSIVTVHGSSTATQGPIARTVLRRVVAQASEVHVLTETHRDQLGRGFVVGNDIRTPEAVAPLELRAKTIVFGGRVGFRKGVDVLLDAWRVADTEGWRLVLAGPIDEDVAEMVGTARAEDERVVVLGAITGEELMDHLMRSQVAVLPSRAEAMPMFLVEALAAGCAVIGTSVGGVPELLDDGRCGLLAEPGDVAALAACITALTRDSDLRYALGRAGRRHALEQSSDASRRWSAAYQRLAGNGPHPDTAALTRQV
jgi:glycosyltransferase involved in cell wall biosynthesis